ncbi:MAG: hypothetical protein EA349_13985 [Halomonadaceae bacterium]|nr:MAG: hypothetical protein EA349_13985 [Halomonadaceae bacterium]
MPLLVKGDSIWPGLLLGVLGFVYVWSMSVRGFAELPHLLSALTVLLPLVVLGILLRSAWPGAVALVIVVIIDMSLR